MNAIKSRSIHSVIIIITGSGNKFNIERNNCTYLCAIAARWYRFDKAMKIEQAVQMYGRGKYAFNSHFSYNFTCIFANSAKSFTMFVPKMVASLWYILCNFLVEYFYSKKNLLCNRMTFLMKNWYTDSSIVHLATTMFDCTNINTNICDAVHHHWN